MILRRARAPYDRIHCAIDAGGKLATRLSIFDAAAIVQAVVVRRRRLPAWQPLPRPALGIPIAHFSQIRHENGRKPKSPRYRIGRLRRPKKVGTEDLNILIANQRRKPAGSFLRIFAPLLGQLRVVPAPHDVINVMPGFSMGDDE
jgi:hypothetical protein